MSIPVEAFETMHTVCRDAWARGLLSGFNGNVSMRLDVRTCCITRSGAAKGFLRPQDVCIVDISTGKTLEGSSPSSELGMHLAIYRLCPDTSGIVHAHPRHLLALDIRVAQNNFLQIPLFEAQVQRARLGFVSAFPPGTPELATATGAAAQQHEAIWMTHHGLCCHASTLLTALALTEELDHLAAVQLLSLQEQHTRL